MFATEFLCAMFSNPRLESPNPWLRRLRRSRGPALHCLLLLLMALPAGARASASPGAALRTTETTLAVTVGGTPAASVTAGAAVTLSATVTRGGAAVTTGQVEFCDASSAFCEDIHLLGTAQLTRTGTASLKIIPGTGSHSYKAVFRASGGNAASTSHSVALAVTGNGTAIATDGSSGGWNAGVDPIRWLNAQTPAIPNNPVFIATGDFNGDGIPDLAVASADEKGGGAVTILLGNGNGSFRSAASLTTGGSPQTIAVGDFNGDGIPDLAVANACGSTASSNTMTIFLGNGDGSFTATGQVLSTGSYPASIAVGDFNGDGTADLAVANAGSNTVTVLLGDGNGSFTAGATQATGDSPASIAAGDFNGDGVLDMVVANSYSNTLTILLGNGDGSFTSAAVSPATGQSPKAVVVGDFNGDGIADLAVANDATGTVTILLGKGDGSFSATSISAATGAHPTALAVGDFNGDGIADLAVVNGDTATLPYHLTILLGNGDGTFKASGVDPPAGEHPISVAVADFNGDGHSDLAVANHGDGSASILLTQGAETGSATGAVASPDATQICPGPQTMNITYYTIAETDKDANRLTSGLSSNYVLTALGTNGLPVFNPSATVNGVPVSQPPDDLLGDNEITWWSPALNNGGTGGISDVVQTSTGVVTLPFANNRFYPPNGTGPNDSNGFQAAVLSANLNLPGTQTISFTISSDDMAFLYLDGQIACDDGGVHAATSVPCTSPTLLAGSHTLQLFFVDLNKTDAVLDFTVTTSGVCTAPITQTTPTITWPTPAPITYGTALSGTQLDATTNIAGAFSYSPAAGTVLQAGLQTLTTTFTPTDTTDYTTAGATVPLTVNKATPTINWAIPAAITYGTALSTTQLDATSIVDGTFSYSPALGTVLPAGQQTLTATFTPTDTTDYTTATLSVILTVNQATPTITWATPAAITYGTALSGTQLDAASSVAGTYIYSPAIGTVLPAGQQTLTATLTPTDTTDYTTATLSVILTVNKAVPTITWATPAAITYGTALSGTQLDASSTVTGTYIYSPALGTVLPAGQQTLTATLTPTDTTDYTTATDTVILTVNKATPTITWTTPAAITYGTALSGTQLDPSSNVAGTYIYSPAIGTVLPAGQQTLTATLTPTDTTDYATATANTQLTVQQAAITLGLTSSTTSVPAGTPFALTAVAKSGSAQIPTGTVTFWNGASSLGTASLVNGVATYSTALFTIGGATLTASYSGDANFLQATSNAVPVTVLAATTTNQLSASPNPVSFGTTATFTSTLTSLDGTPTGSVTFYDGGTALGVSPLISGVATYATSTLSVGLHNITSVLGGTPSFAASTSNTVVEKVADFTLSATPGSGTIYTGESASFTVLVLPVTGFDLPVSLSCSGLPGDATCSFSPQTVSSNQASTMVIQTTAPSPSAHRSGPFAGFQVTALAGLLLFLLPRRWRRAGKTWAVIFILFAFLAAETAMTGCSGSRSLVGGTPVGAQTITIIGTATSGSQSLIRQTTVTLNVKSLF